MSLYYVAVSPKFPEDHPLFRRLPDMRGSRIEAGQSGRKIHNLCSFSENSLALIRETMGGLFREVPDLGGLILIVGGESYYHCYMRPDKTGLPDGTKTNCPRCAERSPEDAVNGLLQATADAVHRVKPEAPVMAWPYSAFVWSSDPAQLELIRGMPTDVALLSTIDKDEVVEKHGYRKHIWDYSIDYTGPAGNLLRQAEIAAERGMELYVKTETALGLECIQFPYVPCMRTLAEKWRAVASLKPAGVLQSWMFFGMWGSRAEELGWWTRWRPELPLGEALHVMAERDFGEHAAEIQRVWELMSAAVSHLPYIPLYFKGPEFIGPAHPIYFEEKPDVSKTFRAQLYYLQENEETFSETVAMAEHPMVHEEIPFGFLKAVMRLPDEEIVMETVDREYSIAVRYAEDAWKRMRSLPDPADPVQARIWAEERILVESLYRTFLSTLHTYRFLDAKRKHRENGGIGFLDRMLEIARSELDNTRAALRLMQDAPWLDLGLRVDGNFPSSLAMMEEKIGLLEAELGRRTPEIG